ncbi:MAG: hypothetical protein NZM11_11375, partial [Anaerolineales bacterium]|nr:hypothetical protein [Anaerolineales bacterium]
MDFPLCLLSAPAGYGKTTPVCDWLTQANPPLGWLTLDDGNNEPACFPAYLAAAIENALPASADDLPRSPSRRAIQPPKPISP